jgi:parallel beta-helix repeat protein
MENQMIALAWLVFLSAAASGAEPGRDCNGAVKLSPGTEVATVVAGHQPGTTYCFAPGLYRLTQTIVPKDGDRFIGASGTILSGAKVIANWTKEGNLWVATGQTQRSPLSWKREWPALVDLTAQYNEDVFLDDRPLTRVLSAAEVGSGKFYFDYDAATIYIGDDPLGQIVECSSLTIGIRGAGKKVDATRPEDLSESNRSARANIVIEGLSVEKFIEAGISLGQHAIIRNNEARYIHGSGIRFGTGAQVLNNRVHHNGKYGISGSGAGVLIEGNEIAFNNTANYHVANGGCFDSGGTKFVLTDHLVVRKNYVHDNYCGGLWSDMYDINTIYEGNRIEHNYTEGIKIEISYATVIRDNTISGNMGNGILISSSPDLEAYGNTISDNGVGSPPENAAHEPADWHGGIVIVQQRRGSGPHGDLLAKNIYIHDNTITMPIGVTGPTKALGNRSVFTQNNRFDKNHYKVPETAGKWWVCETGPCNWENWQKSGQDKNGTVSRSAP